ncbi:pimeloyl-CoA biosynthesis protein BioC [Nitrosospira sp. Nl5]|uniref:class I SAM-dependent methyltransferase n=1 Tax=Nitrosospira sp. Nl5 TaxID=200120 RepID=UPI0008872352|nr:class I SAM-dependent methyltransferase [Nitrosospira sp. Nl5]SCY59629.1 pimeloyl-CoA biosynthesis protein BioC [Nitrosospira sp. Nl5]
MVAKADETHWTQVAPQWIAWARSPQHDVFWAYRDALVEFLGPNAGDALEIGCGEGRVSRELRKLGYRVTATDAVAAMVDAARQSDSADQYAVAGASDLPFDDKQFDLVMAYNVLMDVDDVSAALQEARRVMKPKGLLFISLVHPFRDRGRFAGPEPDAAFILEGTYYGRERFEGEEEHSGLRMHFSGWSQPLQDYMAAMEKTGLAIASLREPVPDKAAENRLRQWTRIPLFIWLKVRIL